MIPYGFVMCWQMLNQSYLVTADKPHIMLVFSILSGCTNIVLDILFMAVWDFGIIGAGLGTIIGMAVGAIPLCSFSTKSRLCTLASLNSRSVKSSLQWQTARQRL